MGIVGICKISGNVDVAHFTDSKSMKSRLKVEAIKINIFLDK